MNQPALISLEKKHEYPILIIDKKGILGEALAHQLKHESLVVLVSKSLINQNEEVLHIPFTKKFPQIPDNNYSHIFLIDEDLEVSKEIVNPLLKKAKKDNAVLIFAINADIANQDFLKKTINTYDNARTVLLGDIFSQNEIYDLKTQINRFIYQAKTLGKIEVFNSGEEELSPVYLEDVISGLLEVAFLDNKKHKQYYLFPKYKITQLMFARMLQKLNPDLKIIHIDKKQKKAEKKHIASQTGEYLLSEFYNVAEKLKKIDFQNLTTRQIPEKNYKRVNGGRDLDFSLIFIFFISFLLLPLITTLLFSFLAINSLYLTKTAFDKNDLKLARSAAEFSHQSFKVAKKSAEVLKEEVYFIGQKDRVEVFGKKIDFAIEGTSGVMSLTNAAEKYKSILNNSSKNPAVDFSQAQTELKTALYIYGKLKESALMPDFIKSEFKDMINISSATIDFWPEILGFNGAKTYLLLFQNNMELRPGGGFIGSYGLLTLENGRLISFKINDVYDADGQLRTHVEPPFPIRRYLPSQHWYLRDSNFNLDYSKGAVASAIFLNSEMHQVVDGVIGIDLYLVKNILAITGPIEVADYKEIVNADNFYQIIQSHAEKDFFPGSTQKKDFLKAFYNAFFTKLTESKDLAYKNLLKSLINSVYEKHIVFAFNEPNIQAAFAINGWSSALFDERKNQKGVINDFLGINEANLGANKVNYYITRSISQAISIADDGTVSESLKLNFKNSSTDKIYKNYLRIALPIGTNIDKILINDKEQKLVAAIDDPVIYEKKNFKSPQGLEVKKENQAENSIYGFLININPNELKTIKIDYNLSEKLTLINPEFFYSLKLFKQPGIDFYPYDLIINYPQSFKIIKKPEDMEASPSNIKFSTQIIRDREIKIKFGAK